MYFIVRTSNVIRFLRLRAQNKAKFSRIRLLYIHLILKPVERPVSVLTGFDRFFGGFLAVFLILKYQKDRDRSVSDPAKTETAVRSLFGSVQSGLQFFTGL